jgi:hypothetical protein
MSKEFRPGAGCGKKGGAAFQIGLILTESYQAMEI